VYTLVYYVDVENEICWESLLCCIRESSM